MDERCRKIIHSCKSFLSQKVSFKKIEPGLKKYKIFTKAMLRNIFDCTDKSYFYDELCTRGPNAFANFIRVLNEAGYHEYAENLQEKEKCGDFPKYYKIDSDLPGYCLIIINKHFDDLLIRKGCKADAKALKNLFENVLHFKVEIKKNKTGQEIEDILKVFSQKSEFRQACCCVVYILSHGGQDLNRDFIYGTDQEKVFKQDIYKFFDNENCKLLIGKPKIFFFQACRGKLLDYRKTVDGEDNTSSSSDEDETSSSYDEDNTCPSSDEAAVVEPTYSSQSDMFIVRSCLPGYKSWKNHYEGSWLCQDLVSVISEYYDKCDLAQMMTIVSDKQLKRESEDGYKQVPHCEGKGVTGLIHFDRKKKNIFLKKS